MARRMSEQDEARLKELRAIPGLQRSPEEEKEYSRLSARKSRYKAHAEQIASTASSRDEFWESNRAGLSPQELESMTRLHERCLDVLCWMEIGREVEPSDDCYVPFEDGVADLLEFVNEHGTTRLGYIKKDQEIPGDWSTREYWRSSELLTKLCDENYQTSRYVRYGLLCALPDWKVANFLTERAGWAFEKVNALLGRVISRENGMIYGEKS